MIHVPLPLGERLGEGVTEDCLLHYPLTQPLPQGGEEHEIVNTRGPHEIVVSPIPAGIVMQYNGFMKRALRYPSRWAGWWRTLGTTAVLSVALGACSTIYGARDGTIEYPGSGAGPNAAAIYVVKEKDTVESVSQRYGVPVTTIVERNRLQQPYTLRSGQSLELPNARFVP